MKKLQGFIAVCFPAFLFITNLAASPIAQDSIFPLISYIHYGEEQGLTTKTVYSIIQDNEGFIWMGTDAGAFRFDGKRFKRFTTKDGLTDNEVLNIYQDRLNRIWFLTFNGHLSFWKDGKIYNPDNTPFLKEAYTGGTIRSAFEDMEGRLWLGTERGIFIMIKNDDVQKVDYPDRGKVFSSDHFYEDSSGTLWGFRPYYLYKCFETNSKDTIALPTYIKADKVCYGNKNSEMYYVTQDGVFKVFDRSVSQYLKKDEYPPFEKVSNIIMNGDNLWLCTHGNGSFRYKNGKLIKQYLEDDFVTSVLQDREGNTWFSTVGKSVFMMPGSNSLVKNFNHSTGLSGEKVVSIASGKNNSIWLGYDNGMVDYIAGNRKKGYVLKNIFNNNFFRVTSLLIDSEMTWCGTDIGVFLIQNEKVTYIPVVREDGDEIAYSIKRLFKGADNRIYCTSNGNLMQVVKEKTGYYTDNVLNHAVRTFAGVEYQKNNFIISSMTGLIEYTPGKKSVEYKTDADFSSIRVLDMKLDNEHVIALATTSGIYTMLNGKILQHFLENSGLSDDNCNKVYISGNHMYVATSNGLDILEKKDTTWSISEVKTIQNGLLSNSINDVVTNNENIYVATDDGLSVIKKTDTVTNIYVGRVCVTELATDSTFMVSDNNYTFKGTIPRLLIRFAYPVFNPVNAARVKYRLLQNETDNSKWHYSQNNEVDFLSLNPGNYIFQLKPDFKSENNSTITSFHFNINPLWWQTTTAKACFSAAVLGIVGLFFMQRAKRKYEFRVTSLKQMNMLDKERNRIASDMHDDIGADLTQISMMANFAKASKDKKDEFIGKIAQTSNEVLKKIDHIIWTLDSSYDFLPDLIYFIHEGMSKYLESSGINFHFETEGEIPNYKIDAIKRRNVFLVIKELVHNSVKHSAATNININVYHLNSTLHILYKENGKGYIIGEVTSGLGHTTMKNRMNEINSTLEIISAPGKGVTAHLQIPMSEKILKTSYLAI